MLAGTEICGDLLSGRPAVGHGYSVRFAYATLRQEREGWATHGLPDGKGLKGRLWYFTSRALDVEVLYVQGVVFYELTPCLNILTH
jgi:hypothetical protein